MQIIFLLMKYFLQICRELANMSSLVMARSVMVTVACLMARGQALLTCPGFPGYCSESFPGQTCNVVCDFGRNNVPLCQVIFLIRGCLIMTSKHHRPSYFQDEIFKKNMILKITCAVSNLDCFHGNANNKRDLIGVIIAPS